MRGLVLLPAVSLFAIGLATLCRTSPAEEAPAAAPAAAPADPALLPLRTAVERGLLEVRGHGPDSYRSIQLELTNSAATPLDVDVCGSFLRPAPGSSAAQRLGLGPVITPGERKTGPRGTVVVTVGAASTVRLRVATVCLDVSKPCPSNQTYLPSAEPLPKVRETVMRWWADNPDAPQHAVNSAIWRNASEVTIDPGESGNRATRPPALSGTWRGGTTYLLRDGVLLSRDVDRIERFLGTEIHDVFPVDGALYAVAQVGSKFELWRHVETGDEPWKRVADLPEGMDLHSLQVLPTGGLLTSTGAQLLRLPAGKSAFEPLLTLPKDAKDLSFRLQPKNRVRVSYTLPPTVGIYQGGEQKDAKSARSELWLIDLAGPPPTEPLKTYWNVASIAQGPGGAYGLTNAGSLRVLRGDSFHDQRGPAIERIVNVGRDHLWAVTRDDEFLAVRLDTGVAVRIAASFRSLSDLRFDDPVVCAALRGRALVRIDPASGAVTELEPAPVRTPR